MKKILLFSACVMLAFASCKKSDKNAPAASNTITATVGGTDTKFNTRVTGIIENSQGFYNLLVTGASSTGSNAQVMAISMLSQKPIAKGTYILDSSTDPNATTIPDLDYTPNISSSSSLDFATDPTGQNSATTTITITSISSTNIQGTFSGLLLGSDYVAMKSITNGTFNATITTK